MSEQPLIYWFELGGQRYRVREVKGTEAIARPFRFELTFVLLTGQSFVPEEVVAAEAALELIRTGVVRRIDGVVTSSDITARLTGAPEVRVVLEPRLALARERVDIRLFRDRTAPEIVVEVLSALGIQTELRLSQEYERRPYCVQHRESDFDFAQRLLEDEGIFYYFLPGDVMVLGDSPAAYQPIEGAPVLPFRAGLGLDQDDEAVIAVGSRARLTPRKVTLRDFNPEKPGLNMQVEAAAPCPEGPEWYDYPGEYADPALGQRKANLRAEALRCAHAVLQGRSFSGRLAPGLTFTLLGAPVPVESRGYVLTRVDHAWNRDLQGFSNSFAALADDVAYRPPLETTAPTLLNPVTAFVTGPEGEDDIHTDEWGRVKVHFHWDRLFPRDDSCSHWVPVLQDNTGQSVSIPRVGWEVLVHFLEGDPDRPVVLGRVYNTEDTFPYGLPGYKSRAALKSLSSPREEDVRNSGSNLIEMEDLAGRELVRYQAERDQTVVVANDKREEIFSHEEHRVERDERITVGGNTAITCTADMHPAVSQNQTWTVEGSRTITCGTSVSSSVTRNRSVSIGGNHTITVKGTDRTSSTEANLTEDIGTTLLEDAKGNVELSGYDALTLNVTGSLIETAGQGKSESTTGPRTEKISGDFTMSAGGAVATRVTESRTTTVKGPMSAWAIKDVVVVGKQGLTVETATTELKAGTKVTLKVGPTEIVFANGFIGFKASESITITSAGSNVQGHSTSSQN